MRADVFLTGHGFFESRSKAKAAIDAKRVFADGKPVTKCSLDIPDNAVIELRGEEMPFVGRGGLKLLGAFERFGDEFSVSGKVCVDIGASTGGFTDCLLRHGAKKVYAVDCGRGQLHKSLLSDERVVNIEGFNARELSFETLGQRCDAAVMDVSFISQTLLYPAVVNTVKPDGLLLSLIKPQFEAGREAIGKNGIVKDEKARQDAVVKVIAEASRHGLGLLGLSVSPIKGGDGNEEYLALFGVGREKKTDAEAFFEKKIDRKRYY